MSMFCAWDTVDDKKPLAVLMGDESNRARFLNPVMASPWHSAMPMGCPSLLTARRCRVRRVQEPIVINFTQRNSSRGTPRYQHPLGKKPSKRDRCVLRLSRLHPELTKTKLRAALTLCDGDITESIRLIRDCARKMQTKVNRNNNNQEIFNGVGAVEEAEGGAVAPLGSFPNSAGVAPTIGTPISDSATTSSDRRSTVTADGSSLLLDSDDVEVCALSDSDQSECFRCRRITWTPPNRVGILLKRTRSGKYTATVL